MKCIDTHEEPNVGTRDAARQLGVSFRELYALIDSKELAAYKVGRDIKLRQDDIDAYSRRRPPSS